MTDSNVKTLTQEVVEIYNDLGLTPSAIKAALIKKGYSEESVSELVQTRGSDGKTYPEILTFMGESPKTEKELAEFILDEGTNNEARWFNDRNKIRKTINTVYDNCGENVREESASEELLKAIKEKGKAKK